MTDSLQLGMGLGGPFGGFINDRCVLRSGLRVS